MPKASAGLVPFRRRGGVIEVLLVHPGGPFWQRKDRGAWSIPKGECEPGEDAMDAARREFREETGLDINGPFIELGSVRQAGGKIVHAWAIEADLDPAKIVSNTFSLEWPPRSGRQQEFPEIDRAAWFALDEARERVLAGQVPLLDVLLAKVASGER